MKRLIITIFLAAVLAGAASAQVTIGSTDAPDKAKLLQIDNSGGLGLPRVQLANLSTLQPFITGTLSADDKKAHTGLMVYNLTTTSPFKKGIYVWDGEKWTEAAEGADSGSGGGKKWFYMPAFNLPMDAKGSKTFDLYAEYQKQFTQSLNTTLYKTSNSSVTTVPAPEIGTLYTRTQLDYVVVNYDASVVTVNSITNQGVMTYNVLDTDPSSTAFMTIVFVVKE
ncbi:hypothetical protein M2463_003656 [Parabacteroides sp. PH5-13]|uniref:hypothetical protein n=1 Tax=unclassified Parabacteroides TaxID=2649774 RepID=UPI0024772825|nr:MULTISPECIES: hypothetical protein [unclassified Parabacteroides]MDH6306866.1 hypothetical protein [Parabacteroides sp. PH5-39]MDH6321618.1 hypothetical protein [Parabacteroides sp. PH5-13]MDH6325253.1 hypothetical protein [Parabacteroides sp. PH5-8]MDH6386366.1 hypothetical protein [Parabacteroides sp. PH5-17]MDH6395722.1 hypothetical protein [Parabacteroides sp. PFB2-22]